MIAAGSVVRLHSMRPTYLNGITGKVGWSDDDMTSIALDPFSIEYERIIDKGAQAFIDDGFGMCVPTECVEVVTP